MIAPQLNEIINADTSIFEKIRNFSTNYISFMIKHPYLPNFIIQELNRNPDFVKKLMAEKIFQTSKNLNNRLSIKLTPET